MSIKQNKTISSRMFKLKNFLSIMVILIFIVLQNQVNAQTNKILFKVDNEIITSFDILNEVKYLIATNFICHHSYFRNNFYLPIRVLHEQLI